MFRSISVALSAWLVIVSLIVLSPPLVQAASHKSVGSPLNHDAGHTVQKHWQVIASPSVGNTGSQLTGVAAVTSGDIWSVGYYYLPPPNLLTRTLAEHWDGSTWQVVASPNNGTDDNELHGVAVVSTNDVWAVGDDFNPADRTLIEHWNGTQWTIVASPNAGAADNQLAGVTALSQNDVWAVGTYFNAHLHTNLTLIEHWNGSKWSIVASPNTQMASNILTGIAAVSANNIWAVGYTEGGRYTTLVEHWNGSKWSIVASPNPMNSNSGLNGLTVITANNIWAAGFYYDNKKNRLLTLVERWNGSKWSIVASPNVGSDFCQLYAVVAVSANDVWAVGEDNPIPPTLTLTEQWNGAKWGIVSSPNPSSTFNSLAAVIAIAVSGNLWAVGDYFNTQANAYETLVEFYG